MRNLIIKKVQYFVQTIKGNTYGATVNFNTGLNIIYGPNSVGKTSLITGIVYALGAEKGLGIFQNKQNPFKPEFYDKINDETITESYVFLTISNGLDIVTLKRSIIGKTDVVTLKEDFIASQKVQEGKIKYLIAYDKGVFSDDGLQKYLFDFFKWDIVEVPTYDYSESKLYFENVLPLFFVEQRAGWAQIQARQVARYGIRDVKNVAFEYLLGLEKFNIHLKEIRRKELAELISKKRNSLEAKEEDILVVTGGTKEDEVIMLQRDGIKKTSIHDIIQIQNEKYLKAEQDLGIISESKDNTTTEQQGLREQLKLVSYQIRKQVEKSSSLMQEISSYEGYIDRIKINQNKNRQIKKLGGIVKDLNLSICPVCENTLNSEEGNCILCNTKTSSRISTPDENLEFLEDEKSTFEQIKELKKLELRKTKHLIDGLQETERSLTENIDHQLKTYVGPELEKYRKNIINLDKLKRDMQVLQRNAERWEKLKKDREEIREMSRELDEIKEEIERYQQSKNDKTILASFLLNFKENVKSLRLLKDKEALVDTIRIDEKDHYTPYLEQYDLYNISSSSDNVRIILSYYLALVQTSLKNPKLKNIKFPNFLLLDEPKQQNLDEEDLIKFMEIIETLENDKVQVILTTFSEGKKKKSLFSKYIVWEMKDSSDYLLKKIEKKKPLK